MSKFIRIVAIAILILTGCQQDVILYQPSDNVSKIYYTTKSNVALSSDTGVINFSDYDIIADLYDNKDGGILYISGTMYNINDSMFRHHEELTTIIIPDSVTTIGDYAFYSCSSLTSVTIPDSVTTIGEDAFCSCNSLTSVYCKATTPPTLDGSSVFDYNKSGRKIYVPTESVEAYKSAENWSDYADDIVGYNFGDAEDDNNKENDSDDNDNGNDNGNDDSNDNVKPANNEIWYTATAKVEPYDASTFNVAIVSNAWNEATGEYVITFDGELTTIGREAFKYCKSLTSVVIPDSVTTIGENAFYYCRSLTSVTIGDSVTTIGREAFKYCESLTSVVIPDSVTTIGENAFMYCDSLTSVYITDVAAWCNISFGDHPLRYGADLYLNNELVTDLTIPDGVTTIGDYAFDECTSLTSVTIPDSVTTIGNMAFGGCISLTSVTIPDSVTTIGNYAFIVCRSLTSVTIGNSVTTIGWEAFSSCRSLTSVTIGDSVTTIGGEAFDNCYSLTSVYCKATTPPSLGYYVFKYYDNGWVNIGCAIYVPAESVEAYKAATNWSEYAADIVGYDFE